MIVYPFVERLAKEVQMNAESNEQIIDDICDYSVKYEVKVTKQNVSEKNHTSASPMFYYRTLVSSLCFFLLLA